MTLLEFKKKVLGLIEELSPDNPLLTEDPDISTKINDVINQVMFELVRMKKIPQYVEMDVAAGDVVDFAAIEKACGYEVYQVAKVGGVKNDPKADGTVHKMLESGTAEIECYELTADVLEIMPYGVAADLLKSDVSTEYGAVYERRYKDMVMQLDPRYKMNSIYIDGGVTV